MHPRDRIVVALVLAVAAVAGFSALTRTLDLGAAGHAAAPGRSVDAVVAHRRGQISLVKRSLQRALQRRPPALPRVPHFSDPPASTAGAIATAAAPAPAAARRVVYVRPPPHVVTIHRAGGGEPGDGGEGSDHGDRGQGGGGDD